MTGAPLPPGTVLRRRFEVGRLLEATTDRRLYEVRDRERPGSGLVLQESPLEDPERREAARDLEEQARACSWIAHPLVESPRHLFAEGPSAWLVLKPLAGVPLEEGLREEPPDLSRVLTWASELCVLLEALHPQQAAGLLPGFVSEGNLLLDPGGHLALVGFHLQGRRLTLHAPGADRSWRPPEGRPCDVWTVGVFLRRMLTPAMLASADRNVAAQVSRVTVRATAPAPRDRFGSVETLRSHLQEILWELRPDPVLPPPRLVSLGWRVRRSFRRAVAASLLVLAALGGVTWGGREALRPMVESLPALGALAPGEAVPTAGAEVWVRGTVQSQGKAALLASPLTNTPSLAYEARLSRTVRREVWDAELQEYRFRDSEQVLLDQSRGRPFLLVDGAARLEVDPEGLVLDGPAWRIPDLAGRIARSTSLGATAAGNPEVLQRAVSVRIGEQVLSTRGVERLLVPSQPVLLRTEVGDSGALEPVRDGRPNLFLGSRADLLISTLIRMIPGLLVALGSIALALLGFELRRYLRQLPRRRALGRLLAAGRRPGPEALGAGPSPMGRRLQRLRSLSGSSGR